MSPQPVTGRVPNGMKRLFMSLATIVLLLAACAPASNAGAGSQAQSTAPSSQAAQSTGIGY